MKQRHKSSVPQSPFPRGSSGKKIVFLVPLSAINPNYVSDISVKILFLILCINTRSMTFVRWLIRIIVQC